MDIQIKQFKSNKSNRFLIQAKNFKQIDQFDLFIILFKNIIYEKISYL